MSRQTGQLTTDFSITSLSASSQQLLAEDTTRGFLQIHNPSTAATLAFTFGATAALNVGGSYVLSPGGTATYDTFVPVGPVQVIGTSGQGCTCITTQPIAVA